MRHCSLYPEKVDSQALVSRVTMPYPVRLTTETNVVHRDLHTLRTRLISIHMSAASFEPLMPLPPIIAKSMEVKEWRQHGDVLGMRLLREAIKSDLDRLKTVRVKITGESKV